VPSTPHFFFQKLGDEIVCDLQRANELAIQSQSQPVALVLCYLSSLSIPIQYFLDHFLDDSDFVPRIFPFTHKDVKVTIVSSSAGIQADFCHVVRSPRWDDMQDQHTGSHAAWDYIAYTRARHKTTVWLDKESCGCSVIPDQSLDSTVIDRSCVSTTVAASAHRSLQSMVAKCVQDHH